MAGMPPPVEPPPIQGYPAPPPKQSVPPVLIALVAVIGMCVFCGVLGALFGDKNKDTANTTAATTGAGETVATETPKEDPKADYIVRIDRELAAMKNHKLGLSAKPEVEEVVITGVVFPLWGTLVNEGHNYELTNEELAKVRKLASETKRFQRSELPKIRKAYGEALDRRVWEQDVEVSVFGSRSTTIQIVGGLFAANKNKKDFQQSMQEDWSAMRFKRSQYKWVSVSDEYTYYDFGEFTDDDIVALKDDRLVKVKVP